MVTVMQSVPIFDDLDEAADWVKFKCTSAPQLVGFNGKLWDVWGDGYAEPVDSKPEGGEG